MPTTTRVRPANSSMARLTRPSIPTGLRRSRELRLTPFLPDATVQAMRALVRLLGRRLPRTSGTLRVAGIHDALRIRRDGWGIPHIDASSEADAWFGLGFCHAQDRAFQLETLLRVGRGTLSAMVGSGGLAADRMSRRLGFARVAAAQLELIDDDVKAAAEAYVRGINQGLAAGLSRRPHEFVLLRARPTPWQVTDVLAFAGLQAFALGANWDMELARLKILAEDGPEALRALDHAYPADHPLSVPVAAAAGPAMDRLADDLAAFASAAPSPGGSNNWAIAGARTASGVPLLANDPHLAARLPAPWYLAHLRCPEWEVAGASFVGGPVLPDRPQRPRRLGHHRRHDRPGRPVHRGDR